jgi:H+/Cl- antiporter ClcA
MIAGRKTRLAGQRERLMFKFPDLKRWAEIQAARWRRELIFLTGGLLTGLIAAGFAKLADVSSLGFRSIESAWPYAPLFLTPAGFAASIYLTLRVFPGAQGSGIPQAIAAREIQNQPRRAALVSIRIAIGKIILTALGLLCGASIGREGPTVQVGASLMYATGRMSPMRQPGLIVAGASAGVAAAFNAPLAGVVFGIEELAKSFEIKTSGLIIATVIMAGLTSQAILGDYTYFGTAHVGLGHVADWLAVPTCGIIGGLMGGIFSRILIVVLSGFPGLVGRWIKAHPVAFAALCGFGVALCGIAAGGSIFGTGYAQARALLDGTTPPPASFGALKFLANTLSSICGIPGGIFSPSMAVGAGMGANLAPLFPGAVLSAMVLLGMVSYFAGVVQAPITAFVIVTEMTDNHHMMVPLMAAAVIATAVSRLIAPVGVYHALARNFLPPASSP